MIVVTHTDAQDPKKSAILTYWCGALPKTFMPGDRAITIQQDAAFDLIAGVIEDVLDLRDSPLVPCCDRCERRLKRTGTRKKQKA